MGHRAEQLENWVFYIGLLKQIQPYLKVLNRYLLLNNKGYCATSGLAGKRNVFISPLLLSDLWGMSQCGPQPLG